MFAYSCFNMIHSNEENIYMLLKNVLKLFLIIHLVILHWRRSRQTERCRKFSFYTFASFLRQIQQFLSFYWSFLVYRFFFFINWSEWFPNIADNESP